MQLLLNVCSYEQNTQYTVLFALSMNMTGGFRNLKYTYMHSTHLLLLNSYNVFDNNKYLTILIGTATLKI